MRKFFKQLFCSHRFDVFIGYEYYNAFAHGFKKAQYKCSKCGKRKFFNNKIQQP